MNNQRGYTLIEILIVLFIISIVTSVALLSIGRNENKKIESFANEIMQMLSLAEEQAMLQPTIVGLNFNEHQLQFVGYQPDEKNKPWLPLQASGLDSKIIPDTMQVELVLKNKPKENSRIIISTSGDITPFTIYVGKKGEKPLYAINGDANGEISARLLV